MKAPLFVLSLMTASVGIGQIQKARTGPDFADLYARVSESAYVVRGRLAESRMVLEKALPKLTQVGPNEYRAFQSGARGGTLFAIDVESTVCRQADFAVATPPPAPLTNPVRIFIQLNVVWSSIPSQYDPNRWNRTESFLEGREYFLFLTEAPGQDELVSTYFLDAGVTYYRAQEGERGAIALPDAAHPEGQYEFATPLVSAVTALCEAVRTDDVETKVRQLYAIRNRFPQAAWRQTVAAAIKAFETPQQILVPPPPQIPVLPPPN